MLATSVFAPLPLHAQQSSRLSSGYCRTPAALPSLGREVDNGQFQQNRPRRAESDVERDSSPSYIPSPLPPPPSSASTAIEPRTAGDIVVTGSARRSGETTGRESSTPVVDAPAEDRVASSSSVWAPPKPQPYPQAGLLTAGEHDDLLNPELYARYLAASNLGQAIPDLPRLDTSRLLSVEVRDSAGRPMPFAQVVLTCSDGNSITLASQADGKVVFFPAIDRISPRATIRVRHNGQWQGPARSVEVASAPGGQQVNVTIAASAQPATKLDLMLVVDTTGSMGDEIRYLQTELQSIISLIRNQHRQMDIRVGFVFYRDMGDDYVTRTIPFDRDVGRAQAALAQQSADGGGDYPEAMDQALIRAAGQAWRPDAIKTMLLVADAPPHDGQFGRSWAAAEVARAQRIHIVPVAASGVADKAEYAMRAMAALTQSRYLFLTDDSGVGNPHAPPAIDCYLVTRLDALLRRVIDSQISGRRIEPGQGEIIRVVGQYDNGRCILPPDFGKDGFAQ